MTTKNPSVPLDVIDPSELYIQTRGQNDKTFSSLVNSVLKKYKTTGEYPIINSLEKKKKKINKQKEPPEEIGSDLSETFSKKILCMSCVDKDGKKMKTGNVKGTYYYVYSNAAVNVKTRCIVCNKEKRLIITKDDLPDKFKDKAEKIINKIKKKMDIT